MVAIKQEFGVPVRYIGVGERSCDLRPFNPEEFVSAMFDGGVGEETGPAQATRAKGRRGA